MCLLFVFVLVVNMNRHVLLPQVSALSFHSGQPVNKFWWIGKLFWQKKLASLWQSNEKISIQQKIVSLVGSIVEYKSNTWNLTQQKYIEYFGVKHGSKKRIVVKVWMFSKNDLIWQRGTSYWFTLILLLIVTSRTSQKRSLPSKNRRCTFSA